MRFTTIGSVVLVLRVAEFVLEVGSIVFVSVSGTGSACSYIFSLSSIAGSVESDVVCDTN